MVAQMCISCKHFLLYKYTMGASQYLPYHLHLSLLMLIRSTPWQTDILSDQKREMPDKVPIILNKWTKWFSLWSSLIPDYGHFKGHNPAYTMVACQRKKKSRPLFIIKCIAQLRVDSYLEQSLSSHKVLM